MACNFEHLDLSNPFGEPPAGFLQGIPNQPLPTPFCTAGQLPPHASLPHLFGPQRDDWSTSVAGPAAMASAAMQRDTAWMQEIRQVGVGDDFVEFEDLGSVAESAIPRRTTPLQRHRSCSSMADAFVDATSQHPGVRRAPMTLFGGKTEIFSRAVDTTPTEAVHFHNLINRDRPLRRTPHSRRRPSPRPAGDFRNNEAWQRAFAAREQTRQRHRQPRQSVQEKPRVSVRGSPGRQGHTPRGRGQSPLPRGPNGQSSSAVLADQLRDASRLYDDMLGHDARWDPMLTAHRHMEYDNGGQPGVAIDGFARFAHPQMDPAAPQRRPTPTPEQRQACVNDEEQCCLLRPDARSNAVPPPLPYRCGAGGVPPPVPASPTMRARSCEEARRAALSSATPQGGGRDCGALWNRAQQPRGGPLGVNGDRADRDAPPPAPPSHELPLREMQRLLGETWRHQHLGTATTAVDSGFGARAPSGTNGPFVVEAPRSPGQSYRGDDGPRHAPPPICSDFVEVSAARAPAGDYGGSPAPDDSAAYVFLGRLVATLPGEEATATPDRGVVGPNPPQAVVECSFWQLRDALTGASLDTRASSARTGAHGPPPAEWATWHGGPVPPCPAPAPSTAPAARGAGGSAARRSGEEDAEELPPWPHEM